MYHNTEQRNRSKGRLQQPGLWVRLQFAQVLSQDGRNDAPLMALQFRMPCDRANIDMEFSACNHSLLIATKLLCVILVGSFSCLCHP